LVALGLSLALSIRLFGIAEQSLWVDEGATMLFAQSPWSELLGPIARNETNPPGYYALMKLWIAVAGTSELAMRLPSALASSLCVVPLYFLCLRATGRRCAVLSVLLFAISGIQVEYAQDARAYALLSLLFATALWAAGGFVDAIVRSEAQIGWLIVFSVASATLPYLHMTGFLAIVVVFVYVVAALAASGRFSTTALVRLSIAGLVTFVVASPMLLLLWVQLHQEVSPVAWIGKPSLGETMWIYRLTFGHFHLPEIGWSRFAEPRLWADFVLVAAAGISALFAVRQGNRHVIGLIAAIVLLMVLFHTVSQKIPVILPRTILFGTVLVFAIVGSGIASIRNRRAALFVAATVIGFQGINLTVFFHERLPKEDWRGVIGWATTAHRAGDSIVLFRPSVGGLPLLEKYWTGAAPEAIFAVIQPGLQIDLIGLQLVPRVTLLEAEQPCPALAGFRRVFVLSRIGNTTSLLEPFRAAMIARGAELVHEQRSGVLRLHLWEGLTC